MGTIKDVFPRKRLRRWSKMQRNTRTSSKKQTRPLSKMLLRKVFSSLRATQMLALRSTKPNRKRLRPNSTQSCRKSTRLQVVHQEECQVVCQAVCQEECQEVVYQIWARVQLQMLETSMISTEKMYN